MGLSETIVAAIIGALATMATAIVQLIRNRAPSESRPKKNRTRSVLATIALMIGCIVGGYAWSALRAVSAREELEAVMDAKYKEQFAAFVANLAPHNTETSASGTSAAGTPVAAHAGQGGVVESLAQLPPCRISSQAEDAGPVTCTERVAQKVSLCAAVPAAAQTKDVRVQARVPKTETGWEEGVLGDASVGSLHLGTATSESPLSADQRSVCLDVANYSVDDTLVVRVIVDYVFPETPSGELTAAAPTAHAL
jgi:hypothetical protein